MATNKKQFKIYKKIPSKNDQLKKQKVHMKLQKLMFSFPRVDESFSREDFLEKRSGFVTD